MGYLNPFGWGEREQSRAEQIGIFKPVLHDALVGQMQLNPPPFKVSPHPLMQLKDTMATIFGDLYLFVLVSYFAVVFCPGM